MMLYAVVTNILGAPLDHWQHVARNGAVALVIGVILAGIYGSIAVREQYITPRAQAVAEKPAEETTMEPATIEAVLDALLARRISRDEAAARIRALTAPRTD